MTSPNMIAYLSFLLFIWTFAAIGIAYVLGHSRATRGIRSWIAGSDLLRCGLCHHGPPILASTMPAAQPDEQCISTLGCAGRYEAVTPLRQWPVLLVECPACLGAWIGTLAGWFAAPLVPAISPVIVILLLAFYTAGTNLTLGKALGLME